MKPQKIKLVALCIAATLGMSALTGCSMTSNSISKSQQGAMQNSNIIKSDNDERDYRYIELDNGLKVALVSDITADKAAASLDVHIGHMSDPKGREGLSHFLEHMLFLGTEKYPKVGGYDEYLKENGGWSNAGTGQEHTNYFFEVNQGAFNEALDRFAQFFIAPTLDPEYVDREKNAVHSEFQMKIKDDARRIREVRKETSNSKHPASQFSVGNLDTLADTKDSKLIDDLKAQYKKYYSASRMALSIVGKEDLDTLEKWAREKFSAVPTNGSISSPVTIDPFLDEQLAVRIDIEPMKDVRTLTLNFPVPNSLPHFKEKPLTFISHLLGNEGEGSLFSYLKQQGLIESLGAYHYGPDDFELFTVSMSLTKKGLADYQKITQAVFAYLKLIANEGLKPSYFDELKAVAKTSFQFQEKHSAANTVQNLSGQLQYFMPENLLNSGYIYQDFSADIVKQYLDLLVPQNMRQIRVAKGLKTDKVQAEYNTPYLMTKLKSEELAQYQTPKEIESLKLPKKNPFIANNLKLKVISSDVINPEVVFEKPGFKLWHKQDSEFRIPKASVNIQIYSNEAGKDAVSRAKNTLYNALLKDSLNEFGYPAKQAGLNYNLWSTNRGMGFGVNGYDEKQVELLVTINKRIRNLTIDSAAFKLHKARLIRSWNNAQFDRPYSQSLAALSQVQRTQVYAPAVLAQALESVTIKELTSYIDSFHREIEIEALVHGNMTKEESILLGKNLHALNLTGSKAKSRAEKVVKLNTSGATLVRELDIDHDDSSLIVSYVNEDASIESRAQFALVGRIINAPFYKSIRTEQQLGYIVAGRSRMLEDLPGLFFLVQSPKAGPIELERRISLFLSDFKSQLQGMTLDKFDDYKAGLIKDLKAKDKNLNERTSRYWADINAKEFNFDSEQKLIVAIEKLSQSDMSNFYDNAMNKMKPIIVRSFGKAHREGEDYKAAQKNQNTCRSNPCFTEQLKTSIRF
ncbi:insulinase family protein [Pseudoalteromonas denitrificans]|uniref:Protease 3 n=1 Tax=Pseudoalteromonas denitrificans DSM 6059 TaxID=1123010 RepID=A0A1I1MC96_9GAMM|nr:insulinase family protein [Pseudoalteromonas denitrificans]SFC82989.1 Secreted Zn-dependent peptidases, insulinase-like [Pseudoalteromonas denitrificans DSM 6059]